MSRRPDIPPNDSYSMGGAPESSGWGWMCRKPSAGKGKLQMRELRLCIWGYFHVLAKALAPKDRLHAVLRNPEKAGQLFGAPTWIQEQKETHPQGTGCVYHALNFFSFLSLPHVSCPSATLGRNKTHREEQNPSPVPAPPSRAN